MHSVAESASGNEMPWKSRMRSPNCLRLAGPRDGVDEQAPHRADAARRDVQTLLDEPGVLALVAAADHLAAAEHGVLGQQAVEAERRVAVRVVVRERRVVDRLDARRVASTRNSVGPVVPSAAVAFAITM